MLLISDPSLGAYHLSFLWFQRRYCRQALFHG